MTPQSSEYRVNRTGARSPRATLVLCAAVVLAGGTIARSVFANGDPKPAPSTEIRPDDADVLNKIIARIDANYARMPVLTCKVKMTTIDTTVKEKTVVRARAGDDGEAIADFVVKPQSVQMLDIVIRNRDMRFSGITAGGERYSIAFFDGIWTQYSASNNRADRWFPRQAPGWINMDPRQIGSWEMKKSFVDTLRGWKVRQAELLHGGENAARLHVDARQTLKEIGVTARNEYEFDPARNYLPTRIVTHDERGTIQSVMDISYDQVIPRAAWFLKKAVSRSYGREGATSPEDKRFVKMHITETQGEVVLGREIPDSAFQIDLPEGTGIYDNTRNGK
jgi:hypothetical protein